MRETKIPMDAIEIHGLAVHAAGAQLVPYRYDPANFAVRVGPEVYVNTLGDGQGLIPARGKQTAYFIVAASAESNVPNDLSVYNDFTAIVRPIK